MTPRRSAHHDSADQPADTAPSGDDAAAAAANEDQAPAERPEAAAADEPSGDEAGEASGDTIAVKANVNTQWLAAGETGDVPDNAEVRACIDQGLLERV